MEQYIILKLQFPYLLLLFHKDCQLLLQFVLQ